MSLLYRDHKGSLSESMKTVRKVYSLSDIQRGLPTHYKITEVKPYLYDSRTGWDAHIVMAEITGTGTPEDGKTCVVGWVSGYID